MSPLSPPHSVTGILCTERQLNGGLLEAPGKLTSPHLPRIPLTALFKMTNRWKARLYLLVHQRKDKVVLQGKLHELLWFLCLIPLFCT